MNAAITVEFHRSDVNESPRRREKHDEEGEREGVQDIRWIGGGHRRKRCFPNGTKHRRRHRRCSWCQLLR